PSQLPSFTMRRRACARSKNTCVETAYRCAYEPRKHETRKHEKEGWIFFVVSCFRGFVSWFRDSTLMLIPSIDLKDGAVVQLVQGECLAIRDEDVFRWVRRFERFPKVQVIDLDAA